MAHQELGMEVVNRVKNDLATMGHVEMEPKLVGKAIGMTLSPLPSSKRRRKFGKSDEDLEAESTPSDSVE
jgi:translation initiation factor IF-3